MQARSNQNQQINLVRSTSTQSQSVGFAIGSDWKPILLSGKFGGSEEAVIFSVEVAAGQSVELFGIQAEAQMALSGYKKTSSQCGVYPQARFMDDDLSLTTEGPSQHSGRVRIHSRL